MSRRGIHVLFVAALVVAWCFAWNSADHGAQSADVDGRKQVAIRALGAHPFNAARLGDGGPGTVPFIDAACSRALPVLAISGIDTAADRTAHLVDAAGCVCLCSRPPPRA